MFTVTGDRIVLHYTEISWGTRTWHQQTTRSTSVKYSAITSTGDVLPSTCLTISQTASVHAWPQYKVRLNCPPDQEEKPEYQQDNVKQSCKQRKKKLNFKSYFSPAMPSSCSLLAQLLVQTLQNLCERAASRTAQAAEVLSRGVWLRPGWATSVTAVAQTTVLCGHRFWCHSQTNFPHSHISICGRHWRWFFQLQVCARLEPMH